MKMESDLLFVMEMCYLTLSGVEIKTDQEDKVFCHGFGNKVIQLREWDLEILKKRASKRKSSV